MELLPSDAEREHLLDELAALIEVAGAERFLAAPVVYNDDTSFPDRWDGDAASVYRLIRRLQVYAGLGEFGLEIWLGHYSEATVEFDHRGQEITRHRGIAGWFAGIEDRTCIFGVDLTQLEQPESLAGTLAHEVSHAYRASLGVVDEDRDREERLTDLTTIYLGFGLLTANAALRFRSGKAEGLVTYWSTQQAGYLAPQSLCYLLAAQVVARGWDSAACKRLARRLELNQAACFRAACDSLERATLLERLGLPEPSAHPAERGLPAVEFDEPTLRELAVSELRDEQPGFRIAQRAITGPALVAGTIAAGGAAAAAMLHGFGEVTSMGIALAPLALLLLFGPRRHFDACADPRCRVKLPPGVEVCHGCRRMIVGRLRRPREWREAMARWQAESWQQPPRDVGIRGRPSH